MARLILATAEGEVAIELGAVNTLGRHPNNSIQLLDKLVSKEHCTISEANGEWVLRDLGGLNGTYVNQQRVKGEEVLRSGDQIALGSTRALFDTTKSAPPLPRLGDRAVPLEHVAVRGEVLGGRARVLVEQRYRNTESRPIEAVYTFPLPSDATVIGFAMTCGDRRIDAEVKEREEAFQKYDDAITAGHGAALLEQERRNVFTCNVGNVLPGEEVTAEIEYVQRLVADEGTLRLIVPTLVAPRYVPGTPAGDRTAHGVASPTDAVPDADRVSPPQGDVTYRVTLDLAVRLGSDVGVRSTSHPIATRASADTVRVSFANDAVPLDRDVVLAFETRAEASPRPVLALDKRAGDKGYFAASFVPDLFEGRADPTPLDVVFVLDRSGSMGGGPMTEARRALRLCLRNLREGDRFAIIAFDNAEELFAPELVPLTQRTLDEADRWIDSIEARGGTEMLLPMVRAAEMAEDGIVVLLTDGQVANEAQIEQAVMERRRGARIYGFGIGTNVSDALLASLAKRTNGAIERIHPGEKIDDKVVAIFARAVAARVTAVNVALRGVEADELAPLPLPDLVDGEPWSIFGRYEGSGPAVMTIRGKKGGEAFLVEVPLDFANDASDPVVARFWAAERVRDLESAALDGRRAEANKARIVKLATDHKIASRYTSFVAIEKRTGERLAQGIPETRVVPVNAPEGWAKAKPRVAPTGASPIFAMAPTMGRPPSFGGQRSAPIPQSASRASDDDAVRTLSRNVPTPAAAPSFTPAGKGRALPAAPKPLTDTDPIADWFARQLVTGLWRESEGDGPLTQLVATLRALRAILARGLSRESPELARYGNQLAKAAGAVLAILRGTDAVEAKVASTVVAALLLVVPSSRAQRALEEAANVEPSLAPVKEALGDTARLRALAEA